MMGYYYNYGPGLMFNFGWIFMLIFLGLIIWGVIILIKSTTNNDRNGRIDRKDEDKIIAILKERYAKGDISKEEYEEKKRDIIK